MPRRMGTTDPSADLTFHLRQQELLRAINTRLDILAATIDPRQRAAQLAVLADHFSQLRMWGRCIKLYRESLQTFDDARVRLALAYVLLALQGEDAWGQVLELLEEPLAGTPLEETAYQVLDGVFRARFSGRIRRMQKADQEEKHPSLQKIVGESEHILEVCNAIVQYASAPAYMPVLITGPSGTGKELVAGALHACGPRRGGPFVPVNCAGIQESVFESMLFGHVKGAFTGAIANHKGYMGAANGGTLFLDEIGQVPLALQAKLLRAIEGGERQLVGASRPEKVDVRFVAATNLDLEKLRRGKQFLEDLYYRLSTLQITMKPLMDHVEDVFLLGKHFATTVALAQQGEPFSGYDVAYWLCSRYLPRLLGHEDEPAVNVDQRPPAHVIFGNPGRVRAPAFVDLIPALSQDPWPGNVRQFQHDVERAVVDGELMRLGDRPIVAGVLRQHALCITSPTYSPQELETSDLRIAGEVCQTLGEAAKVLGVSTSWLSRQSKRLLGQRWRQRHRST